MSTEEIRRVSLEDIQLVQNLVEQCLQLYMSRKEAINTLLAKARIEPAFTDLVWQKLEEENPEFFKQYHLRLIVKDQILLFNQLLERQAELMNQLSSGPTTIDMSKGSHDPLKRQAELMNQLSNGPTTVDISNGSHNPLKRQAELMNQLSNGPTTIDIPNGSHNPLKRQAELMNQLSNGLTTIDISNGSHNPLKRQAELMNQLSNGPATIDISNGSHNPIMSQNLACYGQEYIGSTLQAGDMHQPLNSSLYSNGGSSLVYMQGTVDISNDDKRNKYSSKMPMSNSSNMGYVQGMNEQIMKPDIGYINGSPCMFGPNGNVLDARHAAVEMPVSSYGGVQPHSQPINNSTLFGDDATYESLGKMPKSFSLSDLTADFCLSSEILESYSGSPFLATGSDCFMNPQLQIQQQDNRSLDTKIEGLTYHNFKSE